MTSKRAARAKETREVIFAAAAKVVGRVGYAKASMAAIAAEADVSYGKIYLYFENQQDLFNKLLPHIGKMMLSYIAEQTKQGKTTAERERLGLEANLHYVHTHPELHRVLNEGAFFAPESYRAYFRQMVESYQRSLQKGIRNGEVQFYSEQETESLALMFIGAREYILQHYTREDGSIRKPPPEVQRTYLTAYARAMGFAPSDVLGNENVDDKAVSGKDQTNGDQINDTTMKTGTDL